MRNQSILPLTLPTAEQLAPALTRLRENGTGMILIAVTCSEFENYYKVLHGVFTGDERKALKLALLKCKKKREAASPITVVKASLSQPRDDR